MKKVVKLGGRWSGAYTTLAYNSYKNKDYEKALEQINKALSVDTEFFRAHHVLALILYEKNQLNEAIQECKRCLDLFPESDEYLDLSSEFKECQEFYYKLLKLAEERKYR